MNEMFRVSLLVPWRGVVMQLSAQRNAWTESPAVDMCSEDESFVGIAGAGEYHRQLR